MRKLFCIALATAAPAAALAQDAYLIGVSAAMTGPAAGTYAPVIEAMKAYLDHVNAQGGVNGKPVRLIVLDDGAEPSRAAANAKQLVAQDKVVMLMNTSLSSTYAPMVTESKRADVPLYFAGSVCPKETYPPADPLQFCSTAFGANLDSQAALGFVKAQAKEPVRIGFAAMAIPIARAEIDYAEGLSKTLGMTPVEKQITPPPAPDYTPFATKLKEANPELGVLLVAVGLAGAHVRGDAAARLERPLRHLGAPQRRGRAGAHQGRRALRHRHQRVLRGQPADPRRDRARSRTAPSSTTRCPTSPRDSSPAW